MPTAVRCRSFGALTYTNLSTVYAKPRDARDQRCKVYIQIRECTESRDCAMQDIDFIGRFSKVTCGVDCSRAAAIYGLG